MKNKLLNKKTNTLTFKCKECEKKYYIDYRQVRSIPLWSYESCSKECALIESKNKLVSVKSKKINSEKISNKYNNYKNSSY